jgi:competence protein ComEC
LPGDLGGLAIGILLGGSSLLSQQLNQNFRTVGLSHIVAASGYNLVFVTGWIMALTNKIFGKRRAMLFALVGTILYMFISGLSASIIRAGIMSILSITALYFGRKSDPIWSLALAAVIMIIFDPFIISDIGFQLSVAATLGVLLSSGSEIGIILLVQVLTAPLILHHFGNLSIVAPIANLAVGWTIPLIMQLTVLGLFIGPILFFVWPLLAYMIAVVNWLSQLPFASVMVGRMGWGWVIIYYITIVIVYNRVNDRRQT